MIFIHFPIPDLHPNAVTAHTVALCAERQGKFWEMHDVLFRQQERWGPLKEPGPTLLAYGDSVRIDAETLTACVQSAAAQQEVRSEAMEAARSGARSTPTFIIEGGMMAGAQPIEVWRAILDSIFVVKTGR